MNKKVYFCGSIRGGRQDALLYKKIIDHIKKTDVVLTEHVGDLSLSALEGSGNNQQAIYNQDTGWLRECDVVIAECTSPSLGVGYELAYGEKYKKPSHIFYNQERCNLSAMLAGDDYFKIHPYSQEAEIFPIIDEILRSI